MSGDKLPPGCTGPAVRPVIGNQAETVVYGPTGTVYGTGEDDDSESAIAEAWEYWSDMSGQTRAEYEQRERALAILPMLIATIEHEVPPKSTGHACGAYSDCDLECAAIASHQGMMFEARAIVALAESNEPTNG